MTHAHQLPSVALEVSLDGVLKELAALLLLENDWDGEEAPPIAPATVALAHHVVTDIAREVAHEVAWRRPEVAPNPDGGVSLSWHLETGLLWLVFHPGSDDITYIARHGSGKPNRMRLSPDFAVHTIANTLRD